MRPSWDHAMTMLLLLTLTFGLVLTPLVISLSQNGLAMKVFWGFLGAFHLSLSGILIKRLFLHFIRRPRSDS